MAMLTPAHVGGLHDGNVPGGRLQACLPVIRKPGGADHHLHAQPGADVQIGQRGLGAGEVDQHVGTLQRLLGLVGDGHARGLAHEGAGIRAQRRASGSVQRGGQLHVGGASTASISMRPMRPEAPVMAIFMNHVPSVG